MIILSLETAEVLYWLFYIKLCSLALDIISKMWQRVLLDHIAIPFCNHSAYQVRCLYVMIYSPFSKEFSLINLDKVLTKKERFPKLGHVKEWC